MWSGVGEPGTQLWAVPPIILGRKAPNETSTVPDLYLVRMIQLVAEIDRGIIMLTFDFVFFVKRTICP